MSRAFMRVLMIGKSILRMWSPYVTALLSLSSSVHGVSSVILSIVLLCLRYNTSLPQQWDNLECGENACSVLQNFPEPLRSQQNFLLKFPFLSSVLLKYHFLWRKVQCTIFIAICIHSTFYSLPPPWIPKRWPSTFHICFSFVSVWYAFYLSAFIVFSWLLSVWGTRGGHFC